MPLLPRVQGWKSGPEQEQRFGLSACAVAALLQLCVAFWQESLCLVSFICCFVPQMVERLGLDQAEASSLGLPCVHSRVQGLRTGAIFGCFPGVSAGSWQEAGLGGAARTRAEPVCGFSVGLPSLASSGGRHSEAVCRSVYLGPSASLALRVARPSHGAHMAAAQKLPQVQFFPCLWGHRLN